MKLIHDESDENQKSPGSADDSCLINGKYDMEKL